MYIISYDKELVVRGITSHPLPKNVLEEIKKTLDQTLISLITQNNDINDF